MDKDKKLFLGIILLLLAFTLFVGTLAFKDKDNKNPNEVVNTEALDFKKEYESLNNKLNENNGKYYKELNVSDNNPVDIVNEKEVIDILENKTGIIYFGFPECPWCRSMLPVLLQTLDNANIDNLYYLNILNIRDSFELNDKNQVEKTKEGTDDYYKILDILDEFLETYYLTNSKGKEISTKEKRLLAPTIVGVKEGKIVGLHVATVESQKDPYEALNDLEQEELSNIYLDLINN